MYSRPRSTAMNACAEVHIYTYTYIHTHSYTYIHTYTHIHTHTYIHTHLNVQQAQKHCHDCLCCGTGAADGEHRGQHEATGCLHHLPVPVCVCVCLSKSREGQGETGSGRTAIIVELVTDTDK
jgi:hypothetical protein